MLTSRRRQALVALVLSAALAGCGGSSGGSGTAAGGGSARRRIAVIPKGTTHEFWKSIHAGAVKAGREYGADIIWKGPVREDDRDEQIKVVETFIGEGVDGIVIAPLDDRALVPVLNDARARKLPVVIMDSPVQWDGAVSFVATDNEKGGVLAADRMGQVLAGKGDIVVMRYQEGSASTMEREKGFLDTIASKYPGIHVVSSNQYGGATTESAFATAERLLSTYSRVQGIFCPNESTTFGMLRALDGAGLAGKVHFVGFDATDKLVEALRQGQLDGLVVQNPMRMGEEAVRLLLDQLNGKTVPARVDTGATMVTKENVDNPDVHALLTPDLAAYLD
jgi:ribose transport system substrate-binding protein